jgi:hypothetical protein
MVLTYKIGKFSKRYSFNNPRIYKKKFEGYGVFLGTKISNLKKVCVKEWYFLKE